MHYDAVIIGGGIVGLSVALQLKEAHPHLDLCVLEKEPAVARHQSSRNSGVIHSGIYYQPGSLRATLCRQGYAQLITFCDQHKIEYDICGKLIVATEPRELDSLAKIHQRGTQNGLQGLQLLEPDQAREVEPHVKCLRAIRVPQSGIVNYGKVAGAMAAQFARLGGTVQTGFQVMDIRQSAEEVVITSRRQEVRTKHFVSCAGLYADVLAARHMEDLPYQILPFRGEFFTLTPEARHLVNHLIYPVPDPNFPFLGVHFTRTIEGEIEAGPNAVLAFRREGYHHNEIHVGELMQTLRHRGFRILAARYWRTGWQEMRRSYSKAYFLRSLQRLVPAIEVRHAVRGRSGVRAMACDRDGNLVDDFLILEAERGLHVLNAPSPAATASLAIGKEILHRLTTKINL